MIESRPVWAEINLDNLAHNIQEVRRLTRPEALVTAVIKADGYGHGASDIAKTLLDNGADRFAVATLSEAIRLRSAAPDTPILILGYTPSELAEQILKHNLIQTIYTTEQAKAFSEFAILQNAKLNVHIKLDTGMSRLGFQTDDDSIKGVISCFALEGLHIEGVYTHFACADEIDKEKTHQQVARYNRVVEAIERAGFTIAIKHVSNSASIIDLPEYNFDMVRAGIMLYGLYPSKEVDHEIVKLREVMSLKARVSHVKMLPAGRGISYGHIFTTDKESQIASLPLGYADGFTRMLTGKTNVLVAGKRVPIVGRICMDQCMIMPEHQTVKQGDIVTLFGTDGESFKSIDEVADEIGTINYEIVCMIDKRVPRKYIANGEVVKFKDDLLNLG